MQLVKAVDRGLRRLYHYERFCPKYLTDMLAEQHFHLSNPSKFNDPWDSCPCFDTTQADDPAYRARCIRFIRGFVPHLPDSERLQYEAMIQADRRLFVKALQTFGDALRSVVVARFRTYCLTPKADMPLMWSHYADHHRGICLEFDTSEPLFGNAVKVEYQMTLPAIDILNQTDEASFRPLVTKSPDWCYENEYRIVARHQNAAENAPSHFPITTDDFLPLNPGALIGIILGCRAEVNAIMALVTQHAPDLPVKRAVQAINSYTLLIE